LDDESHLRLRALRGFLHRGISQERSYQYSETNLMHFLLILLTIKGLYMFRVEHAAAQWLRHCATNRKVAGSIPDGVTGIFHLHIVPAALWPWGRLIL
jgi:nitrate reductase gamma subunit